MNKFFRTPSGPLLCFLFLTLLSVTSLAQDTWTWESVEQSETGPGYQFKWRRPYLTVFPGQAESKFEWNQDIADFVAATRRDFVKSFREAQAEAGAIAPTRSWSFEGNFEVAWQDRKNLVLTWHGYQYTVGAHGNNFQKISVFREGFAQSFDSGAVFFDQNAEVLTILSRETRAGLKVYLAENYEENEWLLKGTAPDWENFESSYPALNEKGEKVFRVLFASYQVGPYAIGTPTIDVAWDKIAPYLVGLAP